MNLFHLIYLEINEIIHDIKLILNCIKRIRLILIVSLYFNPLELVTHFYLPRAMHMSSKYIQTKSVHLFLSCNIVFSMINNSVL